MKAGTGCYGLLLFLFIVLDAPFSVNRAVAQDNPASMPAASAIATTSDAVGNSVVKIFSTVRYPDAYKPWTKETPTGLSGSGVLIKGRRI